MLHTKLSMKSVLSITFASLLLAETAFAEGFTVSPALTVARTTNSDKADGAEEREGSGLGLNLNLGLGYTMSSNLHLGAKALYHNFTSDSKDALGEGTSAATMIGFGPTVGYAADSGWNIYFTYLVSANASSELTTKTGTTETSRETKEEESNGFLVEMGYAFEVNKSIGIGPQLVYMSRTYKKETSSMAGVDTVTKGTFTETSFQPYLGFWFTF